jgi:soluble lytic murein transglycosylase-like protein
MKDMLAGFLLIFFVGIFTYTLLSDAKKTQFKRWCKMSINLERKHFIEREAKINDIDPDLIRAIIWVESRGDSNAISPTKCKGLGQVNKGNANFFGFEHKEMFEDDKNLLVMTRLLREAADYYNKRLAGTKKTTDCVTTWMLREYNKGRRVALNNFLAGKSYATLVMNVYQAIKSGNLEIVVKNKLTKIDLSKINGEA